MGLLRNPSYCSTILTTIILFWRIFNASRPGPSLANIDNSPNHFGHRQCHWSSTLTAHTSPGPAQDSLVSSFHALFVSATHNKSNRIISDPITIKNFSLRTQLCLLVLCGDIAVNPGPYVPKYPCGICTKAAKWGQQAIQCDNCQIWFHRECLELSEDIYNILAQHDSYSWICCSCGLPNFDQYSFGNSGATLELSNSYEVLSDLGTESSSSSDVASVVEDNLNASSNSEASLPTFVSTAGGIGSPKLSSSPKPKTKPKGTLGNKHKPLKILNVNCQSIRSKAASFLLLLDTEDPDIVVGTESWLHSGIASGEIFPSRYQVFRRDRTTDAHGGVFLAIKNTLIASEEKNLETETESIWASIHVKGISPVFIGAFYRPQSTNEDYIRQLDIALNKIPRQASIWLLGDFNLPHVDWENSTFISGGSYPAPSKAMIEIAQDHNLHQNVLKSTRENNILDLCFTNSPSFVKNVTVTGGISDHDVVVIEADVKPKFVRPARRKIFLYKKAKYENISEDISAFDDLLTSDYITEHNTNEIWLGFRNTIVTSMNKHIPSKNSLSRHNLPWVNHSIRKDIRKKKRMYKQAKKAKTSESWTKFKTHRRKTDRNIRKAYRSYIRDTVGGSLKENNTKPFWNFIKTTKQEVFGVSTLKKGDGSLATLPTDKANALNDQFCSVFTKEDLSDIPTYISNDIPDSTEIFVTIPGVLKLLNNIEPNKATGPDEIPGKVLRECAESVAPVLTKIFNKSLSTGSLPECERISSLQERR